MSKTFRFHVVVSDYREGKHFAIVDQAQANWDFSDVRYGREGGVDRIYLSGDDACSGDPTFVLDGVAKRIWEANGEYCELEMQYAEIHDIPWEEHVLNEEAYDEWREKEPEC